MYRICLVILMFLASAAMAAGALEEIVGQAEDDCTAIDGGQFNFDFSVKSIDISGDGVPDTLIDSSRFACSTSASLYCGTGGCMLHAVVDGHRFEWQVTGWRTIDWNGVTILLLARDGGWCGASGAERCYEALLWSGNRFLTVMHSPPEPRERR